MQNYSKPSASRNTQKNAGVVDGTVNVPTQKIPTDGYPVQAGKGTGGLKNIPGFTSNVLPGKI